MGLKVTQNLTNLHERARSHRAAGRLAETIAAYRLLIQAAPSDAVAWHNLASVLGDAGRAAEAEEATRRAQALGLTTPETWLVRARALAALGRHDEAESAFLKVLAARPTDCAAHRDLAQLIWMRSGDREASLFHFRDALARNPGDLAVRLALAHVMGQVGDVEGGLALAEEAARQAPSSAVVLVSTANAALAAGRLARAHDLTSRAVALAPQDVMAALAHVQAQLAVGEPARAATTAKALRQVQPNNQYVIALQATAWRAMGDPRYAELYDYTRYVRAHPIETPAGWSSLRGYLDDVSSALNARHAFCAHPFDQSVKGESSQLACVEQMDHPALQAWPDAVTPVVCEYLTATGLQPDISTMGVMLTWSVRLKSGGSHTNHVHPAGLASSACHIAVPDDLKTGPDGWLVFGEPGVATPDPLAAEYWARPEPGVIVLFPSYMWHGVLPFQSNQPRITIAMDVARPVC